jgi:Cu(I)-responsive transcriptional regulator
MIRYYERIGLLAKAARRMNDYRDFDQRDIHDLRFIRRARSLGFSIAEIARLIDLWRDAARPSAEVKEITQAHIRDLEARITEMQAMVDALRHLSAHCHGDARPDCPILDGLTGKAGMEPDPGRRGRAAGATDPARIRARTIPAADGMPGEKG